MRWLLTSLEKCLLQKMPHYQAVAQCIDYIYAPHQCKSPWKILRSTPICLPSYLSRLFKQNLGVSISDYIREKKSKKRRIFCAFPRFTYIQIANYLSFSSRVILSRHSSTMSVYLKQYRSSSTKAHGKFCYPRTIRSVWFSFPSSTANGMQMPVFVSPAYRNHPAILP